MGIFCQQMYQKKYQMFHDIVCCKLWGLIALSCKVVKPFFRIVQDTKTPKKVNIQGSYRQVYVKFKDF